MSTYCPSTYSHSKAVRAYFPVAWKIERAKALYTTGETLVKPAAVKTMCSDAIRNRVSYMILLSNNTIKWHIHELSVDILKQTAVLSYCCEAKWKFYIRVGRDCRFRKRCTVRVCTIACD